MPREPTIDDLIGITVPCIHRDDLAHLDTEVVAISKEPVPGHHALPKPKGVKTGQVVSVLLSCGCTRNIMSVVMRRYYTDHTEGLERAYQEAMAEFNTVEVLDEEEA